MNFASFWVTTMSDRIERGPGCEYWVSAEDLQADFDGCYEELLKEMDAASARCTEVTLVNGKAEARFEPRDTPST